MIGDRVLRKEDARFLTGRGRYLADHDVPGLCHIALVRSPIAHARVRSVDVTEALLSPGVVGVFTQADLEAGGARPMTHRLSMPGIQPLSWGVLATDTVRFVGEPIVAVVATSRAEAEDACELVEVDYEPLPAMVDPRAALEPGAPLLYPEWGTNVFFTAASPAGQADAAIATAPHVLTERVSHHRIQALPLEGHGAQASVDPQTGGLVVIASNQQPHQLRTVIAETVGLPESSVRVIAPDMGGGFGAKQHFTREECLVALLARITGRPVRWAQDRAEGLTASIHARAQEHEVTCGYDDTGKVLGYKVQIVADLGNPVLYFSGIGPSLVTIGCLAGGYDFGPVSFDLRCVATTTCPVGAYRGFGQPEAHVTSERVLDTIAERLGLDPVEVRHRNFLPDAPRPWMAPSGARMDIGSLGPHFDQLLDEVDYDGWRKRQADARAEGRFVGIGLSTLVQGTAPTQYGVAGRFGSWESASVSVLPDGSVTVFVGTKSQGQAHETVFAQVAADALGVPVDRVTVKDGDTAALPYGMGTWGSRSAVMGGGAVVTASTRLREKMDLIATHMGGNPTFDQIAEEVWWHAHRLPHHLEPGLTSTVVYTPGNTIPVPDAAGKTNFEETYGAHMTCVVVEVDVDTGDVELLDAVLVSDCGRVINPMVVEGQHQGAFVQGLGNVLHEEIRYDDEGQPLTATLIDYTPPLATDVRDLRVLHREKPSENAGGFRGMGEAAIIAAPAAIAGAVADALRPLGVEVWSTRLHPHHLRALLRAAR
ncbi:MAG: molybdenum hydroxylase family protein large subunit [Acidimicrobiales bacterium]|nr:molybdenum hydroxylase family protein large subunit [Acidimicrobiales bacterium]